MVLQRHSRCLHIAVATAFQIQAHQIHHPVFGFLKLGSQKFGAEVTCDLHHAFGCVCLNSIDFLVVDDVVLKSVLQRLLEKRTRIVQRYVGA